MLFFESLLLSTLPLVNQASSSDGVLILAPLAPLAPPVPPCVGSADDFESQEMILEENEKVVFCNDVTKYRIFSLKMAKGSFLVLPSKATKFEFRIGVGEFSGENGILAARVARTGQPGTEIDLNIDSAIFDFSPITVDYRTEMQLPTAPTSEDIVLRRLFDQFWRIPRGVGLVLYSRGVRGAIGAKGAKGHAAIEKDCTGSQGGPAGRGAKGGVGGRGGTGGTIKASIRIQSGQRQIDDLDIRAFSPGGHGGIGGDGGEGGNGWSAFVCKGFGIVKVGRRSAIPPGLPGERGDSGQSGSFGGFDLELTAQEPM